MKALEPKDRTSFDQEPLGDSAEELRTAKSTGPTPNDGTNDNKCAHCALPVPRGLIRQGDDKQFCCSGCRTAYELISGCDLEDYYEFAERERPIGELSSATYAEFDSEAFLSQHTRAIGTDSKLESGQHLREVVFAVDGIHCSACLWLIEKLPRICPGVLSSTVSWKTRTVALVYDDRHKLSGIARTLARLGYPPAPFHPDQILQRSQQENRRSLFDLGLAAAAAGNNMLVAISIYLGQYYGMSGEVMQLLVVYSGLISLVSVLGPGRKIIQRAIWALRTATPHMDLPVALGILIGSIAGWANAFSGSQVVFFDSISVLIFVLLLGRYIQQVHQKNAIEKVSLLNGLLPSICRRSTGETSESIPISDIRKDDLIRIEPGEIVPVDGVVTAGSSNVDASLLTGESLPVSVDPGDSVFAGCTNLAGELVIQASGAPEHSRVARIFGEVEASVREKSGIVQFADRVGGWFVLAVIALATITFLLWLPDWMFATNAAVAVLIVACPCALALATPVAISVALGAALKRKILITDGDVFEKLSRVKNIWFDKTGTLTEGVLQVTTWEGDRSLQPEVAAIERRSGHPVARAIVSYLQDQGLKVTEHQGKGPGPVDWELTHASDGIIAKRNGERLIIGTERLMHENQCRIGDEFDRFRQICREHGWSPVFVGRGRQVRAMMGIGDRIRPEAPAVIGQLKRRYQVGLLSGDHSNVVRQVAQEVGITDSASLSDQVCRYELTPEEKAAIVSGSEASLMIGDGINDCAALASAGVGIAINDRLNLNSRIASVVLRGDQLSRIPELLQASRRVMNLIYRNIGFSLAYNVAAVALAMAGYIHPVIAALFMPVSSITILLVSVLSRPFIPRRES